ncbi:hypothetical protein VUR80DRAFT_3761 [Thermomyces stellatus]
MAQAQDTATFSVSPSLSPYLHPPAALASTFPKPIDCFIASTCVFDRFNRLLLIQRSATDGWPLMWEIPGGSVDATDKTVVHAAARELREEAGLTATRFVACVDDFGEGRAPHVWEDDDPDKDWLWCRLAFVVEVEGTEGVVLDEREHRDLVWASEEDVKEERAADRELKFVTPQMKEILLASFRVKDEIDRRRTEGGE